jgi:hypothetical protein
MLVKVVKTEIGLAAPHGVIRLEDLPDDVLEDRGFPPGREDSTADPRERTRPSLRQS